MEQAINKSQPYISWIIPTYREEMHIEKTLREVATYLLSKGFPGGYEIIVVDSSSPDKTEELAKKLALANPSIKVMRVQNRGKGWSVKNGMLLARGKIRMFADADNSVSVDQADNFIPKVCTEGSFNDCADIVIGSIEVSGAKIEEHAQWYRRWLGKTAKYVIRAVSGLWEVHDSQRGFKFFSAKAAERVFSRQTLERWGFDFEVLLIGKRNQFKIKELPVEWINPGGSRVGLDAYLTTFVELLKIKWNDIKGLYTR